jgi:hypothetical protein
MAEPSRIERFAEAYLEMAKRAKYRPAAPGDGMGNVSLSDEEARDPDRLMREAKEYAARFLEADNATKHSIGVSNYTTNRALVYVIEAARSLCGAADSLALDLLQMAIDEIKRSKHQ